jgi:hypothetical protein
VRSQLHALAHGVEHVVLRQRLLDEAERAEPARLERGRRRSVRRHDHDRERLVGAAQPAQHLETVEPGHLDVEKHEVGRVALGHREPFLPRSGEQHLVPVVLEDHPHRVADGWLVIDDEDPRLHDCGSVVIA